jgi:hypothetical protein
MFRKDNNAAKEFMTDEIAEESRASRVSQNQPREDEEEANRAEENPI